MSLINKTFLSALTLAAAAQGWALPAVADAGTQTLKTGIYYIVNDQRHKGSDYHVRVSAGKLSAYKYSTEPKSHVDVFVLHDKGNNSFTIQSLYDGKYVQSVSGNNEQFTVAEAPYAFDILNQTQVDNTVHSYFNIFHDIKNHANCWHLDVSDKIVQWKPITEGGKTGISPSEFRFEPVTTMSLDSVRTLLAGFSKAVDPTLDTASYYQIISQPYSISMREDYVAGHLTTETYSKSDYLFLWKLVKLSSGRYAFRNAVTGKYIVPQNGTKSTAYKTSSTVGSGFKITQNLSDSTLLVFEMYDSNNVGIHCAASQSNWPVGWNVGTEANKWVFKKATIDDAQLTAQRKAYEDRIDLSTNGTTYATKIAAYFDDVACTQLKAEFQSLTDEELTSRMTADSMPAELQSIVLKMKNQSWTKYPSGTNWEQRYRVAAYKPYSEYDYNTWPKQQGLGYNFGNLTNPTGITAEDGDNLYIFVGNDIPKGSELKAELVPLGQRNGTEITLKKGLNIIFNRFEKNIFINYVGKTFNTGKNLKDFAPLNIHIEGGKVNGYFDVTKNDDDSTWVTMQRDGLVWAKAFNMKDSFIVMHMPGADCKQYTPVKMLELVKIWNSIVQRESDLMGFRKEKADKVNNVLNATAVDHGYMYASTGGTYYNYNTLSTVLSYDNMKQGNGVLWGPAHEFGHNMQQLINMAGMTEISNNVFSNMIIYTSGHVTSRSETTSYTDVDGKQYNGVAESKVSTYADNYAAKKYWFEYGTWGTTQMYYKLYLMFHAAGNDTTFFQKWFKSLRLNKMSGRGTTTCRGTTDYLRFALACCEAANQDLSSFFQSWGFFYDVKNVFIGDYSNTTMNTTEQEWTAVLEKMHTYPKGIGNNLIFIDDHIRKTLATYPGHKDGEYRADYSNSVKVGSMGDFGSWDQFCPDSLGQGWAEIVKTTDNGGKRTYTMKALNSHVVGFKVYNSSNELIYFANTKTFTIPKKVMEDANNNVHVTVCGSDGSEVAPGVAPTGISLVNTKVATGKVDVYSISGLRVRTQVDAATSTDGLPAGIYIVNGTKYIVK